ncbi:MAG: WecB/TagA/CpsF family glycosyltransferase, partial [Planctomycetota bacterium]
MQAAVDVAAPEQIINHLVECAEARRGCSVVGVSAPYATAMADDPQLREAFLRADILVPDGQGFAWACKLLGVPCGERLAIPDLCERLLAEGGRRGWKVFIYGAAAETNALACANIAQRFRGLKAVAGQQGYSQGQAEEDAVITRLKNENYNLLIVARPSPEKEEFLARCCHEAGVVGLAAGGYAEILAGKARRAPGLVQALGLEWLYRVVQEPRRLWKRVGWANARFAAAALWTHLCAPAARPSWGCPAAHVAAIALAVCAAYCTSLNVPYHFDDPEYIQDNPTIRSFDRLKEIQVTDFRKLWWLSNAICYRLSQLYGNHVIDRPDVRIFHAWNIACHFIAVLALYGLLRRALRASAPGTGTEPRPSGSGNPSLAAGTPYDLAAAVAAAIFAAHPLCTEAVTYISGRDNGQGGMFYLLGLYAAAVTFERMGLAAALPSERENGPHAADTLRWPKWFWPAAGTMLLGACAVYTKESHLTFFPFAVPLVYLFFYRARETVSAALLLAILVALPVLVWGAHGRREGCLGSAFQIILLLLAAAAVLGRGQGGSATAAPDAGGHDRTAFLRRRVNLNWALLAV